MFDKKWKKFRKGDPITASDRNQIAQQAKNILIGGRGISVTRQGRHVVIDLKGPQIIRPRSYYGTVYKLRAETGGLQWAFDTGDEAYSVFVTSDAVYVGGKRNDNWGEGGTFANVWKLTLGGELIWAVDTNFAPGSYTKQDVRSVVANDSHIFVNTAGVEIAGIPTQVMAKLDGSDGSYVAHGTAPSGRLSINSTQLWNASGSFGSGVFKIRGYDHNLSLGYGPSDPLSGPTYIWTSISCNDTYVAIGFENRALSGVPGGATIEVTSTTPVLGYSDPETLSIGDRREYQTASVDTDYFLTCYHKTNTNPADAVFAARLRDCSTGTEQWSYSFDGFDHPTIDGNPSIPLSPALDETNNICFVGSPSLIEDYGGMTGLDGRCLFALNAGTGFLLWAWSTWDGQSGNDDSGKQIFSICSDRNGYIYAASRTRQEPQMKVAD